MRVATVASEMHKRFTQRAPAPSLPTSQESSLIGLSTSQSTQLPQDLPIEENERNMALLTSLSNKSSQEVASTVIPTTFENGIVGETETKVEGQRGHEHLNFRHEHTSAPKRMANGDIKPPQYSLPTSPLETSSYGHSRKISRISEGSQISEVTRYRVTFEWLGI